jgi:hypothetical protein
MASAQTLMGLGMPAELSAAVTDGVNTSVVDATAAGVRTKQAINDVNDTTPTAAELTTSFGAPATVGSGFVGIVKDADADTNCFVVVSNGTSYFYLKFTKAT